MIYQSLSLSWKPKKNKNTKSSRFNSARFFYPKSILKPAIIKSIHPLQKLAFLPCAFANFSPSFCPIKEAVNPQIKQKIIKTAFVFTDNPVKSESSESGTAKNKASTGDKTPEWSISAVSGFKKLLSSRQNKAIIKSEKLLIK